MNRCAKSAVTFLLVKHHFSAPHNMSLDDKPVPKPTLKHHLDTVHAADSTPPAFKMRVTGVYGGDATKWLVSEAVKINRQEE